MRGTWHKSLPALKQRNDPCKVVGGGWAWGARRVHKALVDR